MQYLSKITTHEIQPAGGHHVELGEAFDVTADKKQTDFKRLPNPAKGNALYESAFEILLKNAKKEAVTVTVQEPIRPTGRC